MSSVGVGLVVAAVALAAAPAPAAADPPRNAVVADLGLHVVGVGLQRSVTPRVAVQLDADYYQPWTTMRADDLGGTDVVGGVVRARVFVYLDRAPVGWWLSPFAQAGLGWGLRADERQRGVVWAAGLSVGHAWLFGNGFTLALGAGVQYHQAKIDSDDADPSFAGLWPHADIIVGHAF